MIATITLLTALSFAVFYPFIFLIDFKDPLKQGFHRFHIGLPTVISGVIYYFVYKGDFVSEFKLIFLIWFVALFLTCLISWGKDYLKSYLIIIPNILGLLVFIQYVDQNIGSGLNIQFICILSSLIYVISLYAMNLGHWYLNVHGLDMKYLKHSVYTFWLLVIIRLVYDIFVIATNHELFNYMISLDGFLLWIPILFAAVLPCVTLFMVNSIIKLKNTQAATGILYVILCGVLLGDIAYKYYLISKGIAL